MKNVSASIRLVAILALLAAPAAAQVPDKFTNLKVLPKDIGKQQLMDVMRGFSGALGVRCTHCHEGKTEGSLQDVDFASDALEPKRVARVMMKMTEEINTKELPATGRQELTRVRCVTCHRGITDPQPLDRMLASLAESEGVDAAVKRYEELRERYYGSASYDFGDGTLNSAAEQLAQQHEDVDGAIALVELNLRHNPESAYSHLILGQLLAEKGDKEAAIASVERAIELEPDNRWARRTLERLKSAE